MQLNIYYVAILSLVLSTVFNRVIFYISKNYSFKKSSLVNEKRLVDKNTPPLGGVASAAAFFISVNFLGDADYNFLIIGAFSIFISILGVIDDFFNLNWKIKLFFQSIFVAIPIIYLNIFLNVESLINLDLSNSFNFFISVLWIILIINSINFIDNMDGLAVIVTGSICYQSILLTYSLNQNKLTDLSVVLLFVILGFFIYNFPPAKLYLGDSGSLFIGFCLGFLSILFTWNTKQDYLLSYALSPVLLFFTIPLLDFLVIMWHRISNGISPTQGGTDHISHRLLAKGFSEKKVLFLFFTYSALNFLLIIGYVFLNSTFSSIVLFAYFLQVIFLFNYFRKLDVLS
jgi:UDP-GlcNAc:undecaprenyl-phosphate GlcNAc-1-phosphate transferase